MTDLKRDYLKSPIDWIRFFFLVRKMYRAKVIHLWEANLDKYFMEKEYGYLLSYRDDDDRQSLADERRKPLKDQNAQKIIDLEDKISKAKAVQASWRKNENFRSETGEYLKLIESLWKKGN